MLTPFQCLHYCSREIPNSHDLLIAASRSFLYTFDLVTGDLLSRWPSPQENDAFPGQLPDFANNELGYDSPNYQELDVNRPMKRQKISSPPDKTKARSAEIVPTNEDESETKTSLSSVSFSAVTNIVGTSNGQYVICVTDDKCIRVLELSTNGALKELSARCMPKRPCSIVLTSDENTILCADKFGDVYALPLLGCSYQEPFTAENDAIQGSIHNENAPEPFAPAANSLTVHTRRNHEALRQQKLVKTTVKKKSPQFEMQLLLGHVSLLTDLVCVSLTNKTSDKIRRRNYILTSDRDEHIRISRGMPQAHIIEGYCLGHTEFVSKLCVPHWCPELLISGGGDDYLLAWDWLSGEISKKIDLKGPMDEFRRQLSPQYGSVCASLDTDKVSKSDEIPEQQIAVSGIWAIGRYNAEIEGSSGDLVVACEGLPALFMFSLDSDGNIKFRSTVSLPGNLLDVAVLYKQNAIIYSLDNYHISSSTVELASEEARLSRPFVGCMVFDDTGNLRQGDVLENAIANINRNAKAQQLCGEEGPGKGQPLSELLYSIENLRKRGHSDLE